MEPDIWHSIIRGLAMLARFLAGAACAAGVLAAVCTPAAAQSFFSSMFGSSNGRSVVSYPGSQKPGTIVINTRDRRLYLVLGNGQALSYGIGVGRVGFTWSGVTHVSAKRVWPDWTPPAQMRQGGAPGAQRGGRRPALPRHMAGGAATPLGAGAMYLGSSLYRIHGSNEPETIWEAVCSGCIPMTNEDAIHPYKRVRVGTRVVVMR